MIELKHVYKIYNKRKENQVNALRNVDLKIKRGELIAIMGPSGAGKSTLLHILAMLEKPDEGSYFLDGEDTTKLSEVQQSHIRNKRIGIVLQEYGLVGTLNTQSNVELPLMISGEKMSSSKKKALAALRSVKLENKARTKVGLLSGGEKQRVALARAIVTDADIILADEPTGALDSKNGLALMNLFIELNKAEKTIIIITHNPQIADMCQRIVYMDDGAIVEK